MQSQDKGKIQAMPKEWGKLLHRLKINESQGETPIYKQNSRTNPFPAKEGKVKFLLIKLNNIVTDYSFVQRPPGQCLNNECVLRPFRARQSLKVHRGA